MAFVLYEEVAKAFIRRYDRYILLWQGTIVEFDQDDIIAQPQLVYDTKTDDVILRYRKITQFEVSSAGYQFSDIRNGHKLFGNETMYDYAFRLRYDVIVAIHLHDDSWRFDINDTKFRDLSEPYFVDHFVNRSGRPDTRPRKLNMWYGDDQIAKLLNQYRETNWCDPTIEYLMQELNHNY